MENQTSLALIVMEIYHLQTKTMAKIIKNFELIAIDGRKVQVKFETHAFGSTPCPHLEFNGFAISETGYYSHFFGSPYETEPQPTEEDAINLAKMLLEQKYLPPSQVGLF